VAHDGTAPAGRWSAAWKPAGSRGEAPAAGVYLAVLRVTPRAGEARILTRRFVLLP